MPITLHRWEEQSPHVRLIKPYFFQALLKVLCDLTFFHDYCSILFPQFSIFFVLWLFPLTALSVVSPTFPIVSSFMFFWILLAILQFLSLSFCGKHRGKLFSLLFSCKLLSLVACYLDFSLDAVGTFPSLHMLIYAHNTRPFSLLDNSPFTKCNNKVTPLVGRK